MLELPALELHDVAGFPLVYVRLKGAAVGYAPRWIEEMSALLRTKRRFVLISSEAAEDESHEDRKARTQWLKTNKEALATWCAGVISIEPDEAKRLARSAQAAGLAKAFGLTMTVVASAEHADALAREYLARERAL